MTVTITGTSFTGATAVAFGSTLATSFTVVSATTITAVVSSGASGPVTVSTPTGIASRAGFTFLPGYVSRLGRFLVDQKFGCAPLTVTILNTNLTTTNQCTGTNPCLMIPGSGSQQQNQFVFTYSRPGTYTLSVAYQNIGADDILITVLGTDVTVGPASSICPGTFAVLTASGASSYTWAPTNGLSSIAGSRIIAMPSSTTKYTVTGTDGNGCKSTADVTVTVRGECVIPNLINGNSLNSYQIISLPLNLPDNRVESVFSSAMRQYGGYDQRRWRFVHYSSGENRNFIEDFSTIEPGKGYWLLTVDPLFVRVSGSPVNASLANPFRLSLNPGWNQIGNPFDFDISWSDVLTQNGTLSGVGKLYVYDRETISFKESDNLPAWGGGFVNTMSGLTLQIPVTVKQISRGRSAARKSEAISIDEPSWFLPIRLDHAGGVNELGGIGMHPLASESRDVFDENTLPRFIKFLELNSYHDDYFQPKFMRDIVPTSDSYTWHLAIESNMGQEEVLMSWSRDAISTNRSELYLYDREAGLILDMKRTGQYSFKTNSRKDLAVLFAKSKVDLKLENTVMGAPFPNPLTFQTTIPFLVSRREAAISVTVYDALGKKIKDLVNVHLQPGYHEVTWNGDDNTGTRVKAGVYVIKLLSSEAMVQATRIFVK